MIMTAHAPDPGSDPTRAPREPESDSHATPDRRTTSTWRWWWQVTAVLQVASVICVPVLVSYWSRWPTANPADVVWWPGVLVLAANILWTFFIAPVIDAGDRVQPWHRPPRLQLLTLRQMVWMPTALTALAAILGLGLGPAMFYLERGRWEFSGATTLTTVLAIAMALSIAWGLMASGIIRRRFVANAAGQHICFECGYPLRPMLDALLEVAVADIEDADQHQDGDEDKEKVAAPSGLDADASGRRQGSGVRRERGGDGAEPNTAIPVLRRALLTLPSTLRCPECGAESAVDVRGLVPDGAVADGPGR